MSDALSTAHRDLAIDFASRVVDLNLTGGARLEDMTTLEGAATAIAYVGYLGEKVGTDLGTDELFATPVALAFATASVQAFAVIGLEALAA